MLTLVWYAGFVSCGCSETSQLPIPESAGGDTHTISARACDEVSKWSLRSAIVGCTLYDRCMNHVNVLFGLLRRQCLVSTLEAALGRFCFFTRRPAYRLCGGSDRVGEGDVLNGGCELNPWSRCRGDIKVCVYRTLLPLGFGGTLKFWGCISGGAHGMAVCIAAAFVHFFLGHRVSVVFA